MPVLIAEDRSALGSVRRAAELARKTWTNQVVAEVRFMWRTLLLFVPAVVLFAIGMNGAAGSDRVWRAVRLGDQRGARRVRSSADAE